MLRFGRSDWIRTSGHLNPIQVLYQTEPHPGGVAIRCACSLSCKQESLTRSAIAPYSQKRKRFWEPCGQIPPLVRFHASVKVSPASRLLLIPTKCTLLAFCGSPVGKSLRLFTFLQAGKSHPLRDCSLFPKTQAFSGGFVPFSYDSFKL